MWKLTPDYVEQVKEELKGRRAAILARHAQELKALEADLEEVETIERLAYSFAAKHLSELASANPEAEPEAVAALQTAEPDAELKPVAMLQPSPVKPEGESDAVAVLQPPAVEPVDPAPASEAKGLSRWRAHLDKHSEPESA
jgi:hypothetical protein